MSVQMLILVLLTWWAFGILSYGLSFNLYQKRWPRLAEKQYVEDMKFCALMGFFGGLISFIIVVLEYFEKENRDIKIGFKFK